MKSDVTSPVPAIGIPTIDRDYGDSIHFTVASSADQNNFQFILDKKESWLETLKYCQRNKKSVMVYFSYEGTVMSITEK